MQEKTKKPNKLAGFLADILRGVCIGLAFIIPGFSGGTVAAVLGIYEKIVGAVADLFKHFVKSVLTLLPIAIGMALGIAALLYPIQLGLRYYPIPTVCFFVGLALGGLPTVFEKLKGGRPKAGHFVACLIPLACAAGLCFLPLAGEVDLLNLDIWGYLLLIVVGAVGASALVVPGISGSMLLLIFGYYNPIVRLITENLLKGSALGVGIPVLLLLVVGMAGGFFGVSVLMKFLLKRFPRGTYFAILGFIVGSIPAVFASTIREAGYAQLSEPIIVVLCVLLLLLGIVLSLLLVLFAKEKADKDAVKADKS